MAVDGRQLSTSLQNKVRPVLSRGTEPGCFGAPLATPVCQVSCAGAGAGHQNPRVL